MGLEIEVAPKRIGTLERLDGGFTARKLGLLKVILANKLVMSLDEQGLFGGLLLLGFLFTSVGFSSATPPDPPPPNRPDIGPSSRFALGTGTNS